VPLLGTYTYTSGSASLADGVNCFAHGLPTTPDWASFIYAGDASTPSIPLHLVSRTTRAVIVQESNVPVDGLPVRAEIVAQFVHSVAR